MNNTKLISNVIVVGYVHVINSLSDQHLVDRSPLFFPFLFVIIKSIIMINFIVMITVRAFYSIHKYYINN